MFSTKKFTELAAAGPLLGSEIPALVQGGASSQSTLDDIKTFLDIDYQGVYDNSTTGDTLVVNSKPITFSSTTEGTRTAPSMLEAQGLAIVSPINGLEFWSNDLNRKNVNTGDDITPNFEEYAYISDIEALQEDVVYGEAFFQDNATETVIAIAGTAVKVNATYSSGLLQEFTHVTGTLTYNGPLTRVMSIQVSLTATLNLATADVSFVVHLNGSPIAKSSQTTFLGSTSPATHSISVSTLATIASGDTLEIFVINDDTTDNITVEDLNIKVHTIGGTTGDPVVKSWDGLTTPVDVVAGANITITGGVIAAVSGTKESLQDAYDIGNEIDQSGGPRVQIRATDDPFLDLIADADGQLVRSGVSMWSENSATTLINGSNIRNWLAGNTPGSEYALMEFQVFDETAGVPVTAMWLSGQQSGLPGLNINGNYNLNATGRGGFGVSVGFPNEIDQSCQFDVKSPFNNLLSKPYPALTQAQIDAVVGPITGGVAYNTDTNRLRINVGTSGSPVRREIAYTSDLPVLPTVQVLGIGIAPEQTYPVGTFTSVLGTLNGTNVIAANTLAVGQTIELCITGFMSNVVNGSVSDIRAILGGVVIGPASFNLNITGFTGQLPIQIRYKVTLTGGLTANASVTGFYTDSGGNLKPINMPVFPLNFVFNPTVANNIDIEYRQGIGGGTEFLAMNLEIIHYT